MEPIAIIGMGCRMPGASSPGAFWQLIRNRVDAIREVPESRWNTRELYDARPQTAGKMSTLWCGVLDGVEEFDHEFFGIPPREAMHMDPQQRLLLEVTWEALEHAGHSPDQLRGSDTGVFIGISSDDYSRLYREEFAIIDAYSGTGNALSVAANRISYLFDLRGPSWVVDTACSSSLVAIHQACQSLRLKECSLAIAGGVNLILSPQLTIAFSQAGMMSPRGRCRAFDDSADGYVRGEGCGLIVLKRFSEAIRDGDNVLALIRGSAVNQDGRTNGLTSPNGLSQQAVIRKALENAGVSPARISYVEAHGTGTSLGDPIEMNSLMEVLMSGRSQKDPCWVGSVKTNIGHLEAAAGIAGLMKVVLALINKEIPPQLHLQNLNRYISFAETPFAIPVECEPWPGEQGGRVAGVSSFGFAGTNAHIILQDASLKAAAAREERTHHVLALSAKNNESLRKLSDLYAQSFVPLVTNGDVLSSPGNICYTANTGRTHFQHRLAVVSDSASGFYSTLQRFAETGEVIEHVSLYNAQKSRQRPPVVFLFTGQGSQYVGMGRALYEREPTFRRVVERCEAVFTSLTGESLTAILYGADNEQIHQTRYAQPALFTVAMGLAELWRQWGIEPGFVMGHSIGEYAAACAAGVFRLEDGLRLVTARGRLMQALPGGSMLAVFATRAEVEQLLQPFAESLSLAALNGPRHFVLSGPESACADIQRELQQHGVACKRLSVSHAFHSPMMQPMLEEYAAVAQSVRYARPELRLISNVSGAEVTDELTRPEYWVDHVLRPVQFEQSIRWLEQQGTDVFVELGPKPTLLALGRACCQPQTGRWYPSLRPPVSDYQQMLQTLAALYTGGADVNWLAFESHRDRRCVSLPTYPFQRQNHWLDVAHAEGHSRASNGAVLHPLLGTHLRSALEEFQFQSELSKDSPGYLDHHRVFDQRLVPAGVFVEMALAAAEGIFRTARLHIENISFEKPLVLDEQNETTVQVVVTPDRAGPYTFQIHSFSPDDIDGSSDWVQYASGAFQPDENAHSPSLPGANGNEEIELRTVAQVVLPDSLRFDADRYFLHPVLLNECFTTLLPLIPELPEEDSAWVPVAIEQIRLFRRSSTELRCRASLQTSPANAFAAARGDFELFSLDGDPIATLKGVQFKLVTKSDLLGNSGEASEPDLYTWKWETVDSSAGSAEFLLAPEDVVASLRPGVAKLALDPEIRDLMEANTSLNKLAVEYILRVVAEASNETHQLDQVAEKLGVLSRHQRLWNRLCDILRDAGALQPNGDLLNDGPPQNSRDLVDEFLNRFSAARPEVTLLDRCAKRLADVLAGRCDPLELIFPGGDLTLATQFYETSLGAKAMNKLIEEAISKAVAQVPDGQRLRVLEIGAGTGGTTAFVLPHVPERTEYVFTDLSPLFLAKAKEKFKDYPFVRYQLFDVEQEPEAQGLDRHSFDIVLAAHVVHATPDLREALDHVRTLLSPNGLLVLLEGTVPIPWVDLIFGLTEGWWKFTDHHLRPSYPLLSLRGWNDVLTASGFESVATVGLADADPQLSSAPSVIVAQNPRVSSSQETTATGKWLIFADSGGIGRDMAERLRAKGATCTIVDHEIDDFKRLLTELDDAPTGVMHFRSLDAPDAAALTTESIETSFQLSLQSALLLAQALNNVSSPPKIWFFTREATAINDNPSISGLSQSPLWGLAKVVALEFPELWGGLIDLPSTTAADEVMEAVLQEVLQPSGEDFIAIRNQSLHRARIVREPPLSPVACTFEPRGAYLITGGLGSLGLKLAAWMVEKGAKHIVLLGRRTPSLTARSLIARLKAAGCDVRAVQADVTDRTALKNVIDEIEASEFKLRGVVHAAGAGAYRPLKNLDPASLTMELRPKVVGAWLLHELTRNSQLDFFIAYSSMVALWGAKGQGAYAAANQFLDMLAHYRRSIGLPGLSINWGLWASEDRAGLSDQLAPMGVKTLRPRLALETFGSLLATDSAQIAVADIDWNLFKRVYETRRRRPLFDRIDSKSAPAVSIKASLRDQLEQAPLGERFSLLRAFIVSELASVIALSASETLEDHQGFFDLGMDSLMAVEFKSRLEGALGCTLPSTLAFDHPTVDDLTRYIFSEVLHWELEETTPRGTAKTEPVPVVDDLSPEQLEDSITKELAELEAMLQPARDRTATPQK
jgi:acyl transferase domain-containing protein/acyl carrier protein